MADDIVEALAQYPRLRTNLRIGDDQWHVNYTPLAESSELCTQTTATGSTASWRQHWPVPLADAPQIGDRYICLHEEWKLADDGIYDRYILAYETTEERRG